MVNADQPSLSVVKHSVGKRLDGNPKIVSRQGAQIQGTTRDAPAVWNKLKSGKE
jgi:hypothetical protein